jgi:Ca2+-binding EF-hand superfamily protein
MNKFAVLIYWIVVCYGNRFQARVGRSLQTLPSRGDQALDAIAMLLLASPVSYSSHAQRAVVSGLSMSAGSSSDEEQLKIMDKKTMEAAIASFQMLDANADGSISNTELKKYLQQYRYTDQACERIFQSMDADGNGEISFDELREALKKSCGCGECRLSARQKSAITKDADDMFTLLDTDKNGLISTDELRSHLIAEGYTDGAVVAVFQGLDKNKDGELSQKEIQDGFLKYAMVREAIDKVVLELVDDMLSMAP